MRVLRKVFDPLQGIDGSEVSQGEDVGPLEDKDEVHVDCPIPDTFQCDERGSNFIVGQTGEG